tara:strand:+ start:441 stop:1715 length:1275 start_codon:yes stop_codon:yes gene_type:complete
MTYNKRKINTKGEKAPSGYHYMQDDSLMSDEEHEKIYGKSFAKTLDCQDCKTIITDGGIQQADQLKLANPFTGDSTIVTNSWFVGAGGFPYEEVAKYDNFFWSQGIPQGSSFVQSVVQPDIREFEIGPNCTVTYIRSISIPTTVLSKGSGMCAKNSTTLIAGNINFAATPTPPFYNQSHICEIDISGTTAVYTSLFQIYGSVAGDIVYIPSTNTIVASIGSLGLPHTLIRHFDMSGTILGEAAMPAGVNAFGLVSYSDEVYIGYYPGIMHRFLLQNHTLIPMITMTNFPGNDMASSPNCDNSPFDGDKYTFDCEIVAYQSKAPYAPIYDCVQKTYPQVGAFLTQQDCINSNCGGPPQPVTIQCSRCNNGSAVSNVFQGTTCPPGWQPASLGDPCKPPTGPTPTDPVLSTPRVPGSTGRTDSSSY